MPNEAEVKPAEVPESGRKTDVLYWSCFVLGCGVLLPWSAQVSAADYLKRTYPSHDAMRWILVCFLPACILTALLNSFVPPRRFGHGRVMLGLLVASAMLLFVPITGSAFVDGDGGSDNTFFALLASVAVLGAAGGAIDAAFSGLAAYLPFDYYQAYVRGWGFSALLSVGLRIVTKAVFQDSDNSLRFSAFLFYILSAIVSWTCLAVYKFITIPHLIWQSYAAREDQLPLLQANHSDDHRSQTLWTQLFESRWIKTAKKIRVANLCMFLIMFAQTAIFPGILTDIECEALGSWYDVVIVAINATSTLVTQWLPKPWIARRGKIVVPLVLLRCLLIPAAFVAVHRFSHPLIISLLIAVLGMSQGYLVLCCFGMGQMSLEVREEALIGGSLFSFFSVFGLCIGSFASLVWMLFD